MRRALAPTRVMKSGLCVAAAAAVAVMVGGVAPASAGGNHHGKPVEDLFSPLGFAIAADGTFYVAEAFSGQLTRVDRRGERTVLVDPVEGQFTAGVDVRGNRISYTLSLPPEFQEFGPPEDTLLNTISGEGTLRQSVSILDYETASNPDSVNLYGVIEPPVNASTPWRHSATSWVRRPIRGRWNPIPTRWPTTGAVRGWWPMLPGTRCCA